MAESLGAAVLDLSTDSSKFNTAIDKAQKKTTKLGGTFKSVGQKLSLGISLPLAGVGIAARKAASDLQESMNAVNVVFGSSAGKVADWGETAAINAGLAQSEFNEAATTMGAMLQNVGMNADAAADSSINLAQRSADMASVFNTDVSSALGAIQAGIRGEIDPLEKFGVSLNMASVEAYAVAQGMVTAGTELTNAQKVIARLGLIMEQTNNVAGDFAETSDQAANAFRVLKSRAEDVAAEFGARLLPVFNSAVKALTGVVDWLGSLSGTSTTLIVVFGGLAAAIPPVVFAIGMLLTVLGSTTTLITGGVLVAIGLLIAGAVAIVENWDVISGFFAELWSGVLDIFEGVLNWVEDIFISAWNGYVDFITEIVDTILGVTAKLGDALGINVEGIQKVREELESMADNMKLVERAGSEAGGSFKDALGPVQDLEEGSHAMLKHWGDMSTQATATADSAKEITKELTAQERIGKSYAAFWEGVNEDWESMGEHLSVQGDIIDRIARTGKMTKDQKLEELNAMEDQLTLNATMLEQAGKFPVTDEARIALLARIVELQKALSQETAEYSDELIVIKGRYFDNKEAAADFLSIQKMGLEDALDVMRQTNDELYLEEARMRALEVSAQDLGSVMKDHVKAGFEDAFTAMGEAAQKGKGIMRAFGKVVLETFAKLLNAMGEYLLIQAAIHAASWNWGMAIAAAAGAAAAYAASGAVSAWAEELEEGGVVTRETTARIGEGGKEEAVIPLEDDRAMDRIAEAIGGGGQSIRVTVNLGNKTLYDDFSKATDNGEIIINPRSVRR